MEFKNYGKQWEQTTNTKLRNANHTSAKDGALMVKDATLFTKDKPLQRNG
jgi:hypothetical protein